MRKFLPLLAVLALVFATVRSPVDAKDLARVEQACSADLGIAMVTPAEGAPNETNLNVVCVSGRKLVVHTNH